MERGILFNRGGFPLKHLWSCALKGEVNKARDAILSRRDKRLTKRYNGLTWKQRMTHEEAISKIAEEENRSPELIEKTIKRAQSKIKGFEKFS